jgi:ABC-2 type transport system permease protein
LSNIAETITWERWEGTIEYTLMAPVSRVLHLVGSCVSAVTHGALRAAVVFVVVVLLLGWICRVPSSSRQRR